MDNTQLQYIKIQSQYIDKLEQFEKCIIKAAKAAHSLADTAEKKCGQAWAALESGNMDVMRNTIQQYISRYGQDWARFRGVQIQRIVSAPPIICCRGRTNFLTFAKIKFEICWS